GLIRAFRAFHRPFEIPMRIDGVGSAVRMAEALGRAAYTPRRSGAFSPPPIKGHQGLEGGLAALIGRQP
nr:hypothetical protein [Ottowia sp.]